MTTTPIVVSSNEPTSTLPTEEPISKSKKRRKHRKKRRNKSRDKSALSPVDEDAVNLTALSSFSHTLHMLKDQEETTKQQNQKERKMEYMWYRNLIMDFQEIQDQVVDEKERASIPFLKNSSSWFVELAELEDGVDKVKRIDEGSIQDDCSVQPEIHRVRSEGVLTSNYQVSRRRRATPESCPKFHEEAAQSPYCTSFLRKSRSTEAFPSYDSAAVYLSQQRLFDVKDDDDEDDEVSMVSTITESSSVQVGMPMDTVNSVNSENITPFGMNSAEKSFPYRKLIEEEDGVSSPEKASNPAEDGIDLSSSIQRIQTRITSLNASRTDTGTATKSPVPIQKCNSSPLAVESPKKIEEVESESPSSSPPLDENAIDISSSLSRVKKVSIESPMSAQRSYDFSSIHEVTDEGTNQSSPSSPLDENAIDVSSSLSRVRNVSIKSTVSANKCHDLSSINELTPKNMDDEACQSPSLTPLDANGIDVSMSLSRVQNVKVTSPVHSKDLSAPQALSKSGSPTSSLLKANDAQLRSPIRPRVSFHEPLTPPPDCRVPTDCQLPALAFSKFLSPPTLEQESEKEDFLPELALSKSLSSATPEQESEEEDCQSDEYSSKRCNSTDGEAVIDISSSLTRLQRKSRHSVARTQDLQTVFTVPTTPREPHTPRTPCTPTQQITASSKRSSEISNSSSQQKVHPNPTTENESRDKKRKSKLPFGNMARFDKEQASAIAKNLMNDLLFMPTEGTPSKKAVVKKSNLIGNIVKFFKK